MLLFLFSFEDIEDKIILFISGFPWIRFWFAVKFYSSDPLNLKEEITR